MPRHLADEQQWRMAQLHRLARLNRQDRDLFGRNLGNELGDASGDLDSVLVELRLPKQAGQHRAPELQLGREMAGGGALVSAGTEIEYI
ncbi:MAG TPA: hypothetical protein VMT28_14495 [Terriglobales bacterium]|nr:hypothetical protein [Terriglobales bacterium]